MPGLLDSLSLGSRAMQTHQKGVSVAGHNLANVNNTAYARQRLNVETAAPVSTAYGLVGNGVEGTAVTQARNTILDQTIQVETGARGALEAQQEALQRAEAGLGQPLDGSTDGSKGLAGRLSDLFQAFQAAAASPSGSAERSTLIRQASDLAAHFRQVDQRLGAVTDSLNQSVANDVTAANGLLGEIARLNEQIGRAEVADGSTANDLRDLRQQKLESLARLVKVETATNDQGGLEVSVGGSTLVSGNQVADQLEAFADDDGRMQVRTATEGTPLSLTGGRIQGTIEARDGAVASLREQVNLTASRLITEANAIHQQGFALDGASGADLFTGTGAADMGVNADLVANPARLQLASEAGAKGDGKIGLQLAQLADRSLGELGDRTLGQNFNQAVADLGNAVAGVESSLADQRIVDEMLNSQRQSVSGVSLDEEMTDLMKYQKAYAASAKLIATIDEMLNDVINLKR